MHSVKLHGGLQAKSGFPDAVVVHATLAVPGEFSRVFKMLQFTHVAFGPPSLVVRKISQQGTENPSNVLMSGHQG